MEKRITNYRKRVLSNLEGLFFFFLFLKPGKDSQMRISLFVATVIVTTQMETGLDIFHSDWLRKQWYKSWGAGLLSIYHTIRRI